MPRARSGETISSREKGLIAVALFAVVVAAAAIFHGKPEISIDPALKTEEATIEDLSLEGFIEVTPEAAVLENTGIVSLTGGCYRVTAGTDTGQAESISKGIENVKGPRPNTHELMRDAFDLLGVEVLMVKVTELKDRNFHGKILLKQGDTILSLDSRPSDGIALATRTGAKIYFNETLMRERGENTC